MIKKFIFTAIFIALSCSALAKNIHVSPWDKNQKEINEKKIKYPIEYPTIYTREKILFNYNPRFIPSMIRFTTKNNPVMRFGLLDNSKPGDSIFSYPKRFFSEKNYIQILNKNGKWYTITSHVDAIRKYFKLNPQDILRIQAGERATDSIEFDDSNNAYSVVVTETEIDNKKSQQTLLIYSKNEMKNWSVYSLNSSSFHLRLQSYRPNSDTSNPPIITSARAIIIPKKTKNGLIISKPVQIAPSSLEPSVVGTMAGAGNRSITIKNKTFFVFMSSVKVPQFKGTPQYIVSYDHKTKKVSAPLLLGEGGHRIDEHNVPVIDIDNKGYIHILAGTHWHGAMLWKSKQPYSMEDGFDELGYVSGNGIDGSYSYSGISYGGMIIDKNNTVHLPARSRPYTLDKNKVKNPKALKYALIYFYKPEGKNWSIRKDLAIPAYSSYSNYYHKIAVDRNSKPFLTYYYYTQPEKSETKKYGKELERIKKLYGEKLVLNKDGLLYAHDPVLIDLRKIGAWRITTTNDLLKSIK